MEHGQLKICLLENVATGNCKVSDMLHTSKDIGKCLNLSKERKGLYSGSILRIDLTAESLDKYIDLSSLASYKVLFCILLFAGVRGRFFFCWHVGCDAPP